MKIIQLRENVPFQDALAGLAPGEPFLLEAWGGPEMLAWALEFAGDRVRGLNWITNARDDVHQVILPTSLVSLRVFFPCRPELSFVVSALKQCPNLRELCLPCYYCNDENALFAALGRSKVTQLEIEYRYGSGNACLYNYLRKNLLTGFTFRPGSTYEQRTLLRVLRDCTKLKALTLLGFKLNDRDTKNFPPSLSKLCLRLAGREHGFDWSFLPRSALTDLEIDARGDAHSAILPALATRLKRAPMERLAINAHEELSTMPLHKVRVLELSGDISKVLLNAVAAAIILPGSRLRELRLGPDAYNIRTILLPALNHPRCRLTKLTFTRCGEEVARRFRQRLSLFALLQGRQVKRLGSPLRRLPVEMLRLVGQMQQ